MVELLIIGGIIWILARSASALRRQRLDRQAEQERERIRQEQQRIQAEQAAQREEQRRMVAEQIAAARERAELRQEQERQRREQERQEKEQARQAAILKRHEEELRKLSIRLAAAESEIAFNREQRDRLFELLRIEETERDACIKGSGEWQKHQRKVISLDGQVYAAQKRIDKAKAERLLCESKLA